MYLLLESRRLAVAAPQLLRKRGDDKGDKIASRSHDLDDVAGVQLVARTLEDDSGQVAVVFHILAEHCAVGYAADDDEDSLANEGQQHEEEERQLHLEAAEALKAGDEQGIEAKDSAGNRKGLHRAEGRTETRAAGVVDAHRL